MRFRPSPELLALLQAKCRTDAELDAFYIYGSIGIDAYLRRDGVVLIGTYDFMQDDGPPRLREASTGEAMTMLVAAAEWTPQLLDLLPKRPDSTPDCALCRGTGWLTSPEQQGLVAAVRRSLRAARRALGLGEGRSVRLTMDLVPLVDAAAATPPAPQAPQAPQAPAAPQAPQAPQASPRIEIELVAWRPGQKKLRVCLACHGIGWHALLG